MEDRISFHDPAVELNPEGMVEYQIRMDRYRDRKSTRLNSSH